MLFKKDGFWSNSLLRIQMICYLSLATIIALGHHILCLRLSGSVVPEHGYSFHNRTVGGQEFISATSNAIAQLVNYLFAATIGLAFAQYFWSLIPPFSEVSSQAVPAEKSEVSHPLNGEDAPRINWEKIDVPLAAANGNPFLPSSYRTWVIAPPLALAALAISCMTGIPIFVPGAIRVAPAPYGVNQTCTVYYPDIGKSRMAQYYYFDNDPNRTLYLHEPNFRSRSIVDRVITAGSYLNVPSPCGICAYKVNFTAGALQCSDITDSYNFTSELPEPNPEPVPLWHGTFSFSPLGFDLVIGIRDGNMRKPDPPKAVRCTALSAEYVVQVKHDNFSSYIDVLNVTLGRHLVASLADNPGPVIEEVNGLARAVGQALNGYISFRPMWSYFQDDSSIIGYGPMLRWTRFGDTGWDSNFTWPDLTVALPSLMQNVSLSLLSGQFQSSNESYMLPVDAHCSMAKLVFVYAPARLLAVYGCGWLVSLLCVFFGFRSVLQNGRENDLQFSHLVAGLHGRQTMDTDPSADSNDVQLSDLTSGQDTEEPPSNADSAAGMSLVDMSSTDGNSEDEEQRGV